MIWRSPWVSLGASALAHVGLAWQLHELPHEPARDRDREAFQVRLLEVPPAPAPREPAPPEPPKPEPPKPEPPKPEPAPKVEPPAKQPEAPRPVPPPALPQPSSAPPALLVEVGSGSGSVVQVAGAPHAALATSARPLVPAPRTPAMSAPPGRLAKLSDLSRKPRAPSLDAALRANYPLELRRRGLEGQAEVRVVIDPRGRVGEIAVVAESATGFAEACRRTLLGSRWSEPLDRGGQPVSTRLTYRCRFQIER